VRETLFRWIFVQVSRALRRTPLRRIKWLISQHDRIFRMLYESRVVRVKDYVFQVDPRDHHKTKMVMLYGYEEDYVQELLISLAVPGSIMVDVGANIGLHAIPLAGRVGTGGRVIAFEPDPDNYRILIQNINSNRVMNISAHKLALCSESGTALLYQSRENRDKLSLRQENVDNSGRNMTPVPVETAVGDDFLVDLDKPISLIKIDVEGAEALALQGMRKTLLRNPAIKVIFEFWPRYVRSFNINPVEFLRQLERDGFSLAIIDSNARCVTPSCPQDIMTLGESSDGGLNILAMRDGLSEA